MIKLHAGIRKCCQEALIYLFAIPIFLKQFIQEFDQQKREEVKVIMKKALPVVACVAAVILILVIIGKCAKACKNKKSMAF